MTREILIATRNEGKRVELEKILDGLNLSVLTLDKFPEAPEVEETGKTFFENASMKARKISEFTGLLTVAEDSGLEVDALDGRPGIYSARYAHGEESTDEENIDQLLKELQGLDMDSRTARFVCEAVIFDGDLLVGQARGEVAGFITTSRQGDNGFGYDPVFLVAQYDKTFGELPSAIKNSISHRAKAFAEIREILEKSF